MNKSMQRIILIVAVLVSGLTYFLQTWKTPSPQVTFDRTDRAMYLNIADNEVSGMIQKKPQNWLLSLAFNPDDPAAKLQDTVMGGLGSVQKDVLAMQIVLYDNGAEWRQYPHPDFPNIIQVAPASDDIPALLRHLRICWQGQGYCHPPEMHYSGSRYIYLLSPKKMYVQYFGDQRWGALALVQDIQQKLELR